MLHLLQVLISGKYLLQFDDLLFQNLVLPAQFLHF